MSIVGQADPAGAVLFWGLALLCGGSALLVVVLRNVVRMAVALLLTLTGVAGVYFMLGAEFVAAVQLVIYVGGTLILIIFGVMLTSRSQFMKQQASAGETVAAWVVGAMLLAALGWGVGHARFATGGPPSTSEGYGMDALGVSLLGDFLVPFEMLSVVLLVVMIGAGYLARARRKSTTDNTDGTDTGKGEEHGRDARDTGRGVEEFEGSRVQVMGVSDEGKMGGAR